MVTDRLQNIMESVRNEFRANLPARQQSITVAWANKDFAGLTHIVHELKGTSGNLQFDQIMRNCEQLEVELQRRPQNLQEINQKVDHLIQVISAECC